MIELRTAAEIHHVQGGWFDARWHFSFDTYRAPEPFRRGVGPLVVLNDDRLVPGGVWPMHPHRDVEGITYVVEGRFRHEDDAGGGGAFDAGLVQRMTLGSGAFHSEQNASATEPMRFLQLWLLPDVASLSPGVEQRQFGTEDFRDRLRQVLGPVGGPAGDWVGVHQDATAHVGLLSAGTTVRRSLATGRAFYVYLVDGEGAFGETPVGSGDAAAVFDQPELAVTATAESQVIVVDVPLRFDRVGVWADR